MSPSKPHFLKTCLVALALGTGISAHGAITYVDPDDIVIPFTFEGVYLDIQTAAENGSTQSGMAGVDGGGSDYYEISYSEPASGDWDVNFFFGGAFIAHNTTFQPYRESNSNNLSAVDNLGLNSTEVIDGGAILDGAGSNSAPLTLSDFGASGTTTGGDINGNQSPTHMGGSADQFASGSQSEGYIGFVLNQDTTPLYGWMRVSLSDDGSTGLIHEWAYTDDVAGIQVGQVPEPNSLLLLLLGAAGLLRRSRN